MTLLSRIYFSIVDACKSFGIQIDIQKIEKDSKEYQSVFLRKVYSPWASDKKFNQTFDVVKENTLVDKYRCYELWQLIGQVKNVEGAILEVGVWRGGTGAILAKSAQMHEIKDPVYLCDTFEGVVKTSKADPDYHGGEHSDTTEDTVVRLLRKMQLKHAKTLKGIFPEDTQSQIKEKKFRFCHIDVDVYQSAKDVLDWVWPKLSKNGVVVFDDYSFETTKGVQKLVSEEVKKKQPFFIHNLNGHAIFIKTK